MTAEELLGEEGKGSSEEHLPFQCHGRTPERRLQRTIGETGEHSSDLKESQSEWKEDSGRDSPVMKEWTSSLMFLGSGGQKGKICFRCGAHTGLETTILQDFAYALEAILKNEETMAGERGKAKKLDLPGKRMGSGRWQRVLNKIPLERNGKTKKLSTTKEFARWRHVHLEKTNVLRRWKAQDLRKKLLE